MPVPPDLAAAFQSPEAWSRYVAENPLPPGGSGKIFDPGAASPYFSARASLSRFGLGGQIVGSMLDAGMQRYAPQYAGMGYRGGRSAGQFDVDVVRYNAFEQMQQAAQQQLGAHYSAAAGNGLPDFAKQQFGQFVATSKFQGALMYGGAIGDQGMANLFQAGGDQGNRFSPTGKSAAAQYGAFTSYYGVLGATNRSQATIRSTSGLGNVDLSGVWRDLSQIQQGNGGFYAKGERILDELKRGGATDEAKLNEALRKRGFDLSRLGGTGEEKRIALGAQAAGVDQYAATYKTLRDVGGSTQSLGASLESIANSFDLSKLDKNKIAKAATDMSEIAAATGKTFEELGGLFETIGKMKGVGLTAKLGAARSYAAAVAGVGGGGQALSSGDQAALMNMTTGATMDVQGSNLALMSRAFMSKEGDLSANKFYSIMGQSLESIKGTYGTETAGMVGAYRRGDMDTFRRISELQQNAMEGAVAEAGKDPVKIAALKAKYGANVEVIGGEARVSNASLNAASRISKQQLTAQTGKTGLMDDATKELIRSSLGLKDLSDEQLEGVMSLANMEGSTAAQTAGIRTLLTAEQRKNFDPSASAIGTMQAGILSATSLRFGDMSANAFAVARGSQVAVQAGSEVNRASVREAGEVARKRGMSDTSDLLVGSLRALMKGGVKDENALRGVLSAFGAVGAADKTQLSAALTGLDDEALAAFKGGAEIVSKKTEELNLLVPTAEGYEVKRKTLTGERDAAYDRMNTLSQSATTFFQKALEEGGNRAAGRVDPGVPQLLKMEGTLKVVNGEGVLLTTVQVPSGNNPIPTGK